MSKHLVVLGAAILFLSFQDGGSKGEEPPIPKDLGDPENCGYRQLLKRVAGGRQVWGIEAWPWMVALVRVEDYEVFCDGVLITARHALTAAHCFNRVPCHKQPKDCAVILGQLDLSEPKDPDAVALFFKEVDRKIETQTDIAIVHFEQRVNYSSKIRPICLPPLGPTYEGETAFFTGWGFENNGIERTFVLSQVQLPVIDPQSRCVWNETSIQWKRLICAGYFNQWKGMCSGDSGGPLMVPNDDFRWMVIGIASHYLIVNSFNKKCAYFQPAHFVRVSSYLYWIAPRIANP